MLAKRVSRCAQLPTERAHIGWMLHMASLNVLDHVALVGFGVAAVETLPAIHGLVGFRRRRTGIEYKLSNLTSRTNNGST